MWLIKNNTISFDFDNTLDHPFGGHEENPYIKETREFVLRLIRRGYDVYIITRRYSPENSGMGIGMEHKKVWDVADELGISKNRIIFTNREWKYSFIESIGACMHIDDDEEEKRLLEIHLPEVKMVWLGNPNWQQDLISKIEEHDSLKIWIENDKNLIKLGAVLFVTILMCMLLL